MDGFTESHPNSDSDSANRIRHKFKLPRSRSLSRSGGLRVKFEVEVPGHSPDRGEGESPDGVWSRGRDPSSDTSPHPVACRESQWDADMDAYPV